MYEFNRHGFRWVEAILDEYAQQIGAKNFIFKKKMNYKNIGQAINFELVRTQLGNKIYTDGIWISYKNKIIRLSTTCIDNNGLSLKKQKDLFFNGLTIIR